MNNARLRREMLRWWKRQEAAQWEFGTIGRTNADATVTVDSPAGTGYVIVKSDKGLYVDVWNRGAGHVPPQAGLRVRYREEYGRKVMGGIDTSSVMDDNPNAPQTIYSVNGQTGYVELDFVDLNDVPTSYATHAGEFVKVTATEDGLEFATGSGGAVDSVNGQTGVVVLDADDISDSGTTHKFTTASDITKLAGIEALADVTDAGNIASSITGVSTDDTIVDADVWGYLTGGVLVKTAWSNIKAVLKTYFDTLYNLYVHPNHTGDVTSVGDGATTIAANAVTFAKMQDIATDSLIGRDSASSGDPENILLGASLSMDGAGNLQRAALTGDVTASANSNATTIATNSVGNAKLRDSGPLSVIGRTANTTGDPGDISATAASGAVLRESGSTLGFGTVATAGVADDAVTNAKAANMAADTIKGRANGAGTGDPTDLTATQVRTIINVADGADVTGTAITALTTKTTPVDADAVVITDSAASDAPKRTTWANIKATLVTYLNTLGLAFTGQTTMINATFPVLKVERTTTLTAQSRAVASVKATSSNDMADEFGPLLSFEINDSGVSTQNIIADIGAVRNGGDTSGALVFHTAAAGVLAEAVRIKNDGTVGIGISPTAQLHVLQATLGSAVQKLVSTATNDDPTEIVYQGRLATTNNTTTTIFTLATATDTSYGYTAFVVGRRTGGSGGAAGDDIVALSIGVVRNISGTVTTNGSNTGATGALSTAGAVVNRFAASGTDGVFQVSGVTNYNISWHVTIRIYPLAT